MNVFETHKKIVQDYSNYIRGFINISDPEISSTVESALAEGKLWPQPLLQFNPSYQDAGSVADIAKQGILHQSTADIFKGYRLYKHQVEALSLGTKNKDFIVTSGTGSGKSLTYIGSIFHHLLNAPASDGVAAVVVYPMNALINSQTNEFKTYKENYEKATGKDFPITFGQYTGQEGEESRKAMRAKPPQILLTNYMMLELLLTRTQERSIRDGIYNNLRFLVFDELHTYRGRQGADVAMLIRRIRAQCKQPVTCIGTSATMSSVGNAVSQQKQVAEVATTVFGVPYTPEQVILETLSQSLTYSPELLSKGALAKAIETPVDPTKDESALKTHPVAVWLENKVALEMRDNRLCRRKPLRTSDIVSLLSADSGCSADACQKCLAGMLLWISSVNYKIQKSGSRYTILPFRLHQFIAQTGAVYTTLDQGPDRFITLEPGIYKQDDSNKKPIFPNVFSRSTGHPFICVTRTGSKLEPREFRAKSEDVDPEDEGYLIVGEDIWDPINDLESLPEAWFRVTKSGPVPDSKKVSRFPQKIYFDEYGNYSATSKMKYWGWYMQSPLLFDPTSGVFYEGKVGEGSKLTKLGSEGRSTSTTITAFLILNQLHEAGYSIKDQKLLSFTDNRQDAALQAGHFNDFVQVVQLRAGIHKALTLAPGNQLDYSKIGEAIFTALGLPFLDFSPLATEPELAAVRRKYQEIFQTFLFYRAVVDLKRSWRIVLPNLEQCGLLTIDYKDLPETVKTDSFWANMPLVGQLPHDKRLDFLSTVLDFFRLEYALHSQSFLVSSALKEYEKRFREELKPPWTLDADEKLSEPAVIRFDPLHKSAHFYSKSMGRASGLGKYIKHVASQNGIVLELKGDLYKEFVLKLMRKLRDADYLIEDVARSEKNLEVPVFRLKIDKILWKLGDGNTVKPDLIKRRSYKDQSAKPNEFFREMYRRDFSRYKRLRAEDHTGQLNTELRLDREDRFRADWYLDETKKQTDDSRIRSQSISALFCSPTMELGIDIGGLSVVHMRNAPPNSANYAQRSGRAGRSGQGALVFTYCSTFSPHDRHYFQHQADMVAGIVQAPKLDLCNQELLLTHLNALAISEIGLPGLEKQGGDKPSLVNFVDDTASTMPLLAGVRDGLKIPPNAYASLKATFRRVIKDFEQNLGTQSTAWYSESWIDQHLGGIADKLDSSMTRWRSIYTSARALLTKATQPLDSGRLQVGGDEYKKYKRLQDQANRQLNLLRNDIKGSFELSEFYPYRYLASEGFLPGYNFTRLPIRVFIQSGGAAGEFISRPRYVALREFGPLNVIYHNGRKFQVQQLVVQDAEACLTEAKISTKAGYFLTNEQKDLEICPFSGVNLGDNANKEHLHDLLEMSESRAEETERISCEEEERVAKGFDIRTYFAVDGLPNERVRKAIARSSASQFLNLRYIPAARLIHVNTKWRSQKTDGFPLGLTSGNWRSSMPEPNANLKEDFRLVKLYTSNLADSLYIEPIQPLGLSPDGVITLQHALKRAIESVFQVESNEIGVVTIGDSEAPNILLYEAAEGSLGILSQFVDNVQTFRKVIVAAKAICRYDDPKYLAPASYDDLLSYYNQRDHKVIDRMIIQDALEKLLTCDIEIQTNSGYKDYEEQYQSLLRNADPNSSTERAFLKHLYEKGLRLPDVAQKRIDGIYCQPDFYYEPRFWVFCDGSPHDDLTVKQRDASQRQAIIARGDEVWSWYYKEDLAAKIAQRPDVFRKVK